MHFTQCARPHAARVEGLRCAQTDEQSRVAVPDDSADSERRCRGACIVRPERES
jgi:hypothetical protein